MTSNARTSKGAAEAKHVLQCTARQLAIFAMAIAKAKAQFNTTDPSEALVAICTEYSNGDHRKVDYSDLGTKGG